MSKRTLLTGVAYHGNRMPSHYRMDLEKIARADMDIVVHMLSHTDWERHAKVIKEMCRMTMDAGMDVWVDNWGLGGSPGDKSHFLTAHPECRMVLSNGEMHPTQICLNQPEFRKFVRKWIDTVADMGVSSIIWDEPMVPTKRIEPGSNTRYYACACPTCKKIYEEKFGHEMTLHFDAEAEEFGIDTMVDFFRDVTDYSASLGLKNVTCLVPRYFFAAELKLIRRLAELPHMDNLGTDPYWSNYGAGIDPDWAKEHSDWQPYEYVYDRTKRMLEVTEQFGKEHNLWIQTHMVDAGHEEEIIWATEAAYDAGAKCILSWSFAGAESNNYRCGNPERAWEAQVEGMRRIRSMERDRVLAEHRAKYKK